MVTNDALDYFESQREELLQVEEEWRAESWPQLNY